MTLPRLEHRDNLCQRTSEPWRPPNFAPPSTVGGRLVAFLRRCLDLQAASIWNDLQTLLPACQGTVLDVGCGAQPYRGLLSPEARYVGIDTADAREQFGYSIPDTLYFEGSQWPVDSGSVDLVLSTETLEHVPRPLPFLQEARRCLKPGGCLLLTVPFAARWHYIPHDYWRFTPSGLKQLLLDAGFDEPVVYARGNAVTVACYKAMALILALLLGGEGGLLSWGKKLVGLLLSPLLAVLALIGQMSLWSRGGNDCLGYTVVAAIPGEPRA
jgi:SAM-dependent methyltransferase